MSRTWAEVYHSERYELKVALQSAGCHDDIINAVFRSGYYLKDQIVYDSFISWNDWWPTERLDKFVQRISGKSDDINFSNPRVKPERILVNSVDQAYDAIKNFADKNHIIRPMFYRGQRHECRMRREIPNPIVSGGDGTEPLIIPSLYRVRGASENPDLFEQRAYDQPVSIFHTPKLTGKLIYCGLPNGKEYAFRNLQSISSLEFSSNPELREYHRRWRIHEVNAPFDKELPLVEQHYGISTQGLDLTNNLETALFFALYTFIQRPNGKATYIRGDSTDSAPGVVYCFDTYSLKMTDSDIYREIGVFDHITPVRPLKQSCAYIICPPYAFNQVVVDVKVVLEVSPKFNFKGIPSAEELFPGRNEDRFYSVLLELREDFPLELSDVVHFEWD